MTWHRGPRPVAIRLFALAFLAAALIRLVTGLADLTSARQRLGAIAPPLGASHDAAIVTLSAEFTIALIPLVWIYGLRIRRARWLVLGFGGLRLAGFAVGLSAAGWVAMGAEALIEAGLIAGALAALLSPGASAWLIEGDSADAPRHD